MVPRGNGTLYIIIINSAYFALAKTYAYANLSVFFVSWLAYNYEATTMAGSSCEDISISGGHDPRNCAWSDEFASNIRRDLEHGQYPVQVRESCPPLILISSHELPCHCHDDTVL